MTRVQPHPKAWMLPLASSSVVWRWDQWLQVLHHTMGLDYLDRVSQKGHGRGRGGQSWLYEQVSGQGRESKTSTQGYKDSSRRYRRNTFKEAMPPSERQHTIALWEVSAYCQMFFRLIWQCTHWGCLSAQPQKLSHGPPWDMAESGVTNALQANLPPLTWTSECLPLLLNK